jgi:uncharacterized phiE125 gp8 family phage protein
MLIEITRPAVAPEMVAELAEALRLPQGFGADPGRDARLARVLETATGVVEAQARRALLPREAACRVARWEGDALMRLPLAPVATVAGLAIEDGAGGRTVVDPAAWRLDALRGALVARAGARIPAIPLEGYAEARFTAGFAAWAAVPADLRLAVITLAAALHDGADARAPVPGAVAALLAPYRPVRL